MANNAQINAIGFKQGKLVTISYDSPAGTGTLRSYDPATDTWTDLPMKPGGLPIDRPGSFPGVGTRFVSAQKALYYMSRFGLAKVEDIGSGFSRNATIPPPLVANGTFKAEATTAVTALQAGGWLGSRDNTGTFKPTRTAYRITVARFGANHELIESEPSDRLVVDSRPDTESIVTITIRDSWMVSPDSFYRIYRSEKQSAANADPTDEMFLVREIVPTAAPGADGYLTPLAGDVAYQDVTPDKTGLVVPLYTNEVTGGTAAAANSSAPVAADMCFFRGRMHYFNTIDYGRLVIQILGVGNLFATGDVSGIRSGDSFTINGVKFTYGFGVPPNDPTGVQLFTFNNFTDNIEQTAQATVNTINHYFAKVYTGPKESAVLARYISSTSGTDIGRILLQTLVPNASPITFQTSSAQGFDRDYTSGIALDASPQVAGWRWSHLDEPEAVPLANNSIIGDASAPILRAIPIKESLFVFKSDGLWRISDDQTSLGPQLQIVDPTVRLLAPETAVALDNFVVALCDSGVLLISETGAPLSISHNQIERDLSKLVSYVGQDALRKIAFGIAYQAEHVFLLALPESPYATACTKQYCYSLQSQAWTTWDLRNVLCGSMVPTTNQLVWGCQDTLWFERKDSQPSDYQDVPFTIGSPTTIATATLTFAGDHKSGQGDNFAVGDIVQQAQTTKTLRQRVTAVSYSNSRDETTVTLNAAPPSAWDSSIPLTVLKSIQSRVTFLPVTAGAPTTGKDWSDSFLAFSYCDLDFVDVGWSSDRVTFSSVQNNLEPISSAITTGNGAKGEIELSAFGAAPFGQDVWSRITKNVLVKATLPRDFAASSMLSPSLTVGNALASFALVAWSFQIAGTQKADR